MEGKENRKVKDRELWPASTRGRRSGTVTEDQMRDYGITVKPTPKEPPLTNKMVHLLAQGDGWPCKHAMHRVHALRQV